LYAPRHKLLISGDALWEKGFGVLHIALEGERTIELAAQTLDTLARLDVELVIPGHGWPFGDYTRALERARRRLDGYHNDRARTLQYNLRAAIAFWLLANEGESRATFTTFLRAAVRSILPDPDDETALHALAAAIFRELSDAEVLVERDGAVSPGRKIIWDESPARPSTKGTPPTTGS
jgi:hypothetical protein